VVTDFGIARAVSQAGGVEQLTESGVAVGTLAYMSPEQVAGRKDLDGRTDIYSLGCVLYEMLAGEVPLVAPSEGPGSQLRESRDPVSAALASVIDRALARLPADRFPTAAQFTQAVVAATQSQAAASAVRARKRTSRWVWLVSLATVLGVGAAAYFGGFLDRFVGAPGAAGAGIRLAVLPLENLTGDPAQEYFSDGLTAEMITQLGRLAPERLGVIARTSAMRYKRTDKPVDQIGRELGVDYVLEGSARRDQGRVRITAQLIRVGDQTQLWAESYERELSGILEVQSDIAQGVARSLAVALLPGEQTRMAIARPVDPDAYEAYLKGLFHAEQLTPSDLARALEYFELALSKDPRYALAYTGITRVWIGRNQMGYVPPGEAMPKARAAARRALELDSTLAVAHFALGTVAWAEWDWETNEKEFRRSIELDPNFPDVRAAYSGLLFLLDRPAEAMSQIERAVQLDPFNAFNRALFGMDLYFVRRYEEAVVQLQDAVRTMPDLPFAHCGLWYSFEMLGSVEQALTAAGGCLVHYGPEVQEALARGRSEAEYRAAMRRAGDRLATGVHSVYVAPIDVFLAYLHAGEHVRALEWLSRAVDARDPNAISAFADPATASLRDDARFQALARRMRLPL
jgi:TolB-like protein/tetratricopeptide (TPR) repeat protein